MGDEPHGSRRSGQGDEVSPRKRAYDLTKLLSQVRPGNVHPEEDLGPAVGREAW